MAKKLQCIKNMKEKLIQMQKQLLKMEQRNSTISEFPQNWKSHTSNSISPQPPHSPVKMASSWKNPTFWDTNPILGKENSYTVSPSKHLPLHHSPSLHNQLQRPSLKQKMNCKSLRSIGLRKEDRKKEMRNENCFDLVKMEEGNILIGKRRDRNVQQRGNNIFFSGEGQGETPRFEKIKTYDHPMTDPILNPDRVQEKGKKIVMEMTPTPITNLVSNPRSNPDLYFFKGKATPMIHKGCNRRNVSPQMKELLSTSLESKQGIYIRKNSKKHFAFQQTYGKWY